MSSIATAIVAAGVVSAGSSAYSSYQEGKAIKGARDLLGNLKYEEDPLYTSTQEKLNEFGIDLLGGKVPDYYKSIGEAGGPEFENYMSLMTGDIQKGVESASAATGRRGGSVGSITAKKVGEFSTKSRLADYMRALTGKVGLLNTGLDTLSGVRASAFNNQTAENQFNMNKTGSLSNLLFADAGRKSDAFSGYMSALSSTVGGLSLANSAGLLGGVESGTGSGAGIGGVGGVGAMTDEEIYNLLYGTGMEF